ncbi:MAG: hypothetical protein KDJ74_04460 [Notoacmeibacter sp.]|nr:hypothetical protein [Notoacmeibacter sp.]
MGILAFFKKRSITQMAARPEVAQTILQKKSKPVPEWARVLTDHVSGHFEEIPAELVADSFHLFSEEVGRPLREISTRIAEIDKELMDGFSLIKAVAPELAHRALSRTPLELEHYIEPEEVLS